MIGGVSYPIDDSVFLVSFDSSQATDAAAPRYEGQGCDDLVLRRASAIENRALGFYKGLTTRLALEPLSTCLGLAEPDDVLLALALPLSLVCTVRI